MTTPIIPHSEGSDQNVQKQQTYLLHFDTPLGSARHSACHYAGKTCNLARRMNDHKNNRHGAKIMQALHKIGGTFRLAKTWDGYDMEQVLKRSKKMSSYCPICKAERLASKMIPTPLYYLKPELHQSNMESEMIEV